MGVVHDLFSIAEKQCRAMGQGTVQPAAASPGGLKGTCLQGNVVDTESI